VRVLGARESGYGQEPHFVCRWEVGLSLVLGMILFPQEIAAFIGQVFRKMRKKQLIGVEVAAVLVLLAGAYLWGPGSAPRGQEPVVTLSEGNPGEFEKALDAETDVPRLVLLLSPT
jgi:hypothetical protein